MTLRLGVIMDPIQSIIYKKDSTLAMLWEAQARGWELYYFEQKNLFIVDGVPHGEARRLSVKQDEQQWFALQAPENIALAELDVILMRKDPPYNQEYIYTTYMLDHAERLGVLVVNRPQALRDCNEKFFVTHFPQCSPATLVTQSIARLRAFWEVHQDIVCKPLNAMGGASVYRLQPGDVNANTILESLTHNETIYIMAQKFIPDIKQGDKRIIMINGEPVPFALARVPQGDEWRGNLAVGAIGVAQALSKRDEWICAQVGPVLRERGLYFVGIDVIGDYLTEINVTSPTGIRELDASKNLNISAMLMDMIQTKINKH